MIGNYFNSHYRGMLIAFAMGYPRYFYCFYSVYMNPVTTYAFFKRNISNETGILRLLLDIQGVIFLVLFS